MSEELLFSHTVINSDRTITCTQPTTKCKLVFRDPNDLSNDTNVLDYKRQYPFPAMTHNIHLCRCPIKLKEFWFPDYRDKVIEALEQNYGNLRIFSGIDEDRNVSSFWYSTTVTESIKSDAWSRIDNWERMLRMLATCKSAMGIDEVPRDLILTSKAYLQNNEVKWKFDGLSTKDRGHRHEGPPEVTKTPQESAPRFSSS